ncbi:hypothetical protein [Ornithinimicrobium murale]|uniref:hypothetical protein n=1 Tax=Ornithinimicrobium murale TaxID=1050153 RepID=UPI000E0D2DF2|nr:hypothetical protein [Ornithinimicrobium murale]
MTRSTRSSTRSGTVRATGTPATTVRDGVSPVGRGKGLPRRGLLASAGAVAAGGALTMVSGGTAAAARRAPASDAVSDPDDRTPVLIGANPGIQLFDEAGECTAYASVWRVSWSPEGTGDVLILWRPDGVTVYSANRHLAQVVTDDFTRHFPEMDGLPWPDPVHRRIPVVMHLDMARGLWARAGAVEVRMSDVLDIRSFTTDQFPLGGVPHSLHLVLGPCGHGQITVRGRRLPGAISVGSGSTGPSSSAFVTDAEVWRR